ncbi:MAG: rod shape-determining protein MreC [Sandaracinaceae bacterium]|nr:rod shape-determining protein MreC [Sandaracinaceae bacterium]
MTSFKRFRDAAICVALLAIPFFFLNANLKDPDDPEATNALDRSVLSVSAPIQTVAATGARWFSGIWQDYVYLVDVKEENDRLRSENARLAEETRRLRHEALENRRLRSLLSLRERIGGDLVGAQVIGRDVSRFFRVTRIRLDRGERDRVRPGMPVITSEGLVGQVRRSWGRYSDVLLTVDRTSAIDVVVQRTGARGMLRGTGEDDRYLAQIQYLRRQDDIRVGDLVHTSGLGQRFPASILVGRVTRIVRREFGLNQEAEVTPSVSFSSLDEVLILTEGSRTQTLVEEAGEGTSTGGEL